jgi:hypothetical protein
MMDKNEKSDHAVIIKQQIDEVIKEIEKLKNQTSTILNAAELAKFDKDIAKKTHKLAGLLTAKWYKNRLIQTR